MPFYAIEIEKSQIIGFTVWADTEDQALDDARALAHEGHLPITAYPLGDPSFRVLGVNVKVEA